MRRPLSTTPVIAASRACRAVGSAIPGAIGDIVAAIGDEELYRRRGAAQRRRRTTVAEPVKRHLPAEGDDLDRTQGARPEAIDRLRLVNDCHHPRAGAGDDLLAQQGAASPRDEIQRPPLDLVGAIQRQVDVTVHGEIGQRQAELASPRLGSLRGWNADDAQPLRDACSEAAARF
jgi:hypothetical protein